MKHFFLSFLFISLFIGQSFSQKIHWADEVVSFSSEYSDKYYSASQVLGVPNALSPKDLSQWSWSPKKQNAGKEHIKVRFKNAVIGVRQVYIAENAGAGAISKIVLYDTKGKKHVVYENKYPKPLGRFNQVQLFKISFPPTNYYVAECMIEINTKAVPGANIDAIGITDYYDHVKLNLLINNLEYRQAVAKPENLGRQINSNYAERLPIISPDGNTLYFTRKFHPQNIGASKQQASEIRDDIWVSKRMNNNQWSHAENIGAPLNTDDHNFVVSVNPTGTNIYLGNKYRTRSEGISMSSPKKGAWGKPIDLRIENHYNDNKFVEYHVSVDESILLMSVERNEGFGERDLYVSFHKGEGNWTKPKNLGNTINTVNIESSVFLAADGKTLYFSSNGHYNYGGLDVFMTKRLDNSWTSWSEPKNLGPKINTVGNDYNYTIPASGEYAYFSSDENSYGMSDLFRILLPEEARPEPVMLMTGRIVDVTTNKPIQAKVKYNPLEKKKKTNKPSSAPSIEPIKKQESEAMDDGSFQVILPYGENVEVYADIEGYFPISESMELADEDLEELDSDTPDDPLMNFEYKETAPSKEEIALENEMARLERELEALKKKKTNPKPYEAPFTRSQVQTSSSRPYNKPKPKIGKDSELDYLKEKYYAKLNGKSEPTQKQPRNPANKNDKEVNSMYDKLYGKKKEDKQPIASGENSSHSDTPSKPKPRKEDKEVNSMYDKLYGKKKEEDKPKKDPFAPDEEEESSHIDEEEVVADIEEIPKENIPTEEEAIVESTPEDQPSFEDMEKDVRRKLRDELIAQIKAELREELMDEVKEELKDEAKNKEEEALLNDVVVEVKRETQKDLASIPTLNAQVNGKEDEIELELKALIVAEMKEELKVELETPIKEELKDELALRTKKKEKDEAQKKMDDWKKRRDSSSAKPTGSPAPKKDPEYVELNQDIQVVPIKVGQVIPMNNIFFDANKHSIKEQSSAELERVLGFLKDNPKLIVEVGGHTNGWCSSSFADELSRGRAKNVRNFFIENGVPENRIQYRGYGKQMPIATNETLQGRKKNQRVELKILEILD